MNPLDLKRMKVLLVDDEAFIRTTLRQILVQIGVPQANVYEANAADAGVVETLRIRPDVVFCDIHMPIEDGFTFVAKLRKLSLSDVASTPVVMLTSDATQNAVVTAKEMNVDGYLVKPVSVNAVKRALDLAMRPSEEPPSERQEGMLIIDGDPADLLMISNLLKELYNVRITRRF